MNAVNGEMICPNCGRPFSSRECADDQHRSFHPTKATSTRECTDKAHVGPRLLPLSEFVTHGARGRRAASYRTCKKCRFRKKVRRRQKKRGAAMLEIAASNAFWNEQAARHK